MKRSRFALSVLLVPALVLAGGGGGGGSCSGSGGSPSAPVLNLPSTVLGHQMALAKGSSTFTMTLSGVPGGLSLTNTAYSAWCSNPSLSVPSAVGVKGAIQYTVYNSYSALPQNDSNVGYASDDQLPGVTGPVYNYTLAQEWAAVNYVLNNPNKIPANADDVQAVIWQLLHPETGLNYITINTGVDGYAVSLFNDAVANGLNFIPANGQLVAVVLDPGPLYQGVIIPICVTGGGCSGKSSVALYKCANVSTASAFQVITYGYLVVNTGSTTLTNIVVTDDNGTPHYSEDDFLVGTIASLAPGASQYFYQNVYLPIHLFAQSGNNPIFDTLIPQAAPTTLASGSSIPAGALVLTYLQDVDVFDNTYGTPNKGMGASAGWGAVGGHELAQDLGNYARMTFYDNHNNLVSDFEADYLSTNSSFPSGFGSDQLHGPMLYGSSSYVQYITSTLSENLNGDYTSPVNPWTAVSPNNSTWQTIGGYKVQVAQNIFNTRGGSMGHVNLQDNFITNSKIGTNLCYSPQPIGSKIVNTAYLTANVQNCCTVLHAQACVSVWLNGCPPPSCQQNYQHRCSHQDECRCPCPNCQAGKHNQCTQQSCSDPRCEDKGCPQQCQCHCIKCSQGDHAHCVKNNCGDAICRKNGCPQKGAGSAQAGFWGANVYGIFNNGSWPANGGLDTSSYAYSETLAGTSMTWSGLPFQLGNSGTANAFANTTVTLPQGNFNNLYFLGTAVWGSQVNQNFTVTYTDGSTSTFTQSLSDWGSPQNYPGESVAASDLYRVTPKGGTQYGPWQMYGYSFPLNNGKTVKSLELAE